MLEADSDDYPETGDLARTSSEARTLEPRLSGRVASGRSPKSANKLLTGDPGTIDTTQQMEILCD